jgi:RNA polymerase sigma factor (sigma-70 family)
MADAPAGSLLRHIRHLLDSRQGEGMADGALLERYVRQRDEAAFESLVARHAPLVWGVCHRVLSNDADAEDTFQATFLVLASRAASVRRSGSIGSWLYGVAWRLACRMRVDVARRSRHEHQSARRAEQDTSAEVTWRELKTVLDEELALLPETLRAPLVLCYLEGQTRDEAARQLGWKPRTLKARVDRGRRRLRVRLARRGLALSTGLVAPMLADASAVPVGLAAGAARAALRFAAGQTEEVGTASASVIALARAGLAPMAVTKLQSVIAVLLIAVALGTGTGMLGGLSELAPAAGLSAAPAPTGIDRNGDPLPAGAVARLGTLRFRNDGLGLNSLSFLPDGKTLVSTSGGREIRFWDAATGRLLRQLKTELEFIGAFALSHDGRLAAIGGSPAYEDSSAPAATIRVIDLASGKEVRAWSDSRRHRSLALSADGKHLVSQAGNGILRIEEVSTGNELARHRFPEDSQDTLALSPDGKTLAVAAGPNVHRLFLWDWQDGEEPREVKLADRAPLTLAFSPDCKTLAGASDIDGTVSLWEVTTGRLVQTLKSPNGRGMLSRVAFAPDGKVLALAEPGNTRTRNGSVTLWDPTAGKVIRQLPTPGESPGALTFSPDSHWLAAATGIEFHVWDLRTGEETAADDTSHRGWVNQIAFGTNGMIATASDDHTVRLWDLATGQHLRKLTTGNYVRAVSFSPDGSRLVTSSMDGNDCLWDTATGKQIFKLAGHGVLGGRRAVAFTPDGKRFLSYGDDFYLRTRDATTGKATREIVVCPPGTKLLDEDAGPRELRNHVLSIGAVALSGNGKTLAIDAWTAVFIFDVETGKELLAVPNPGGRIERMAISADGKFLLASTVERSVETRLRDGTTHYALAKEHSVYLWELPSGKLVHRISMPGHLPGPVALSCDEKYFATGIEKPRPAIIVRDVASGNPVRTFTDIGAPARALAFAPDGRHLVAALRDTSALVLDLTRDPGGRR